MKNNLPTKSEIFTVYNIARAAARRDYHGVCKHVESERLLLAIFARRADHLFIPLSVSVKNA